MEKALISIIVPIYNAEKNLNRCLRSLQCQVYDNIEILLINDGSIDSSGDIAESYSRQDKRFKTFHLKNGGVAQARNYGIQKALGEYISFVDADDYVDKYYIEKMYKSAQMNNVQMVTCDYLESYDTQAEIDEKVGIHSNEKTIFIDEDYDYTNPATRFIVWGALYKAELLDGIEFEKNLCVGEDALFVARVMDKCKKYVHLETPLYIYMIYEESASHGVYNEKKRTEVLAAQRIREVYKNYPLKFKKNINAWYVWVCLSGIRQMISSDCMDEKWFNFLYNEIKLNAKDYIYSSYDIKKKLQVLLLIVAPFLMKKLYKLV